jgi:hypothetical protein
MIIDNCVPDHLFNELVDVVTDWDCLSWFFSEYTAHGPDERYNDLIRPFQGSWAHTVITYGRDNSVLASLCRQVVNSMLHSFNQELLFLSRVRIGLITRTETRLVHNPHVDFYDVPHKTVLLYLNDSDGDTIFYNKFHSSEKEFPLKCTNDDIEMKVSPKSNRAVSFNGWQYHSSSTPILNNYRIVMNVNYTIKTE